MEAPLIRSPAGPRVNRVRSLGFLNEVLISYYQKVLEAHDQGRLIAYVFDGFPTEILWAMNIVPVFPQKYSGMYVTQSARPGRSSGVDIFNYIEGRGGYSQDLCASSRASVALALYNQDLDQFGNPLWRMPKPDLLITANNICDTVTMYAKEIVKRYDIPAFCVDTPYIFGDPDPNAIRYVGRQLRELIAFLEGVSGQRFDYDRLVENAVNSLRAVGFWTQTLDLAATRPSPTCGLDLTNHLLPLIMLRGTEEAVLYYRTLKAEVDERVRTGVAAVPGERHRLLWDIDPVYHRINYFGQKLAAFGAVVVGILYNYVTAIEVGARPHTEATPDSVLDSLAHDIYTFHLNRDLDNRMRLISRMAEKFGADAMVINANRGCKACSGLLYEVNHCVREKYDIPILTIDCDVFDPRFFSESQMDTRVEAFLETLG
jgi:benzoyl-CoA reductase/2-hydroxyglutaryl-CoA dehydratase subunit BcrC/BadD/HgdB